MADVESSFSDSSDYTSSEGGSWTSDDNDGDASGEKVNLLGSASDLSSDSDSDYDALVSMLAKAGADMDQLNLEMQLEKDIQRSNYLDERGTKRAKRAQQRMREAKVKMRNADGDVIPYEDIEYKDLEDWLSTDSEAEREHEEWLAWRDENATFYNLSPDTMTSIFMFLSAVDLARMDQTAKMFHQSFLLNQPPPMRLAVRRIAHEVYGVDDAAADYLFPREGENWPLVLKFFETNRPFPRDRVGIGLTERSTYVIVQQRLYMWGNGCDARFGFRECDSRAILEAQAQKDREQAMRSSEMDNLQFLGNARRKKNQAKKDAEMMNARKKKEPKRDIIYDPRVAEGLSKIPFVEVRGGSSHVIALTREGCVVCFGGKNQYGEMGSGDRKPHKLPVLLDCFIDENGQRQGKITRVDAGANFSIALTEVGNVFTWGCGTYGRLGNGFTTKPTPTSVRMLKPLRVKEIAAGDDFVLVLTNAGRVWSWGHGKRGQLGHDVPRSGNYKDADENLPREIESLPRYTFYTNISAGAEHSLAVSAGGLLYTWGYGRNGRLGHGDEKNRWKPKACKYLSKFPIATSSAGFAHSAVKTQGGRVWTFGEGADGKLGLGDEEDRLRPACVESIPGLCSRLRCGPFHTIVLTKDNKLYGWGVGDDGRLGIGDVDTLHLWVVPSPMQIRFDALTVKNLKIVGNLKSRSWSKSGKNKKDQKNQQNLLKKEAAIIANKEKEGEEQGTHKAMFMSYKEMVAALDGQKAVYNVADEKVDFGKLQNMMDSNKTSSQTKMKVKLFGQYRSSDEEEEAEAEKESLIMKIRAKRKKRKPRKIKRRHK